MAVGFFNASLDPTQPDDYESRAYKRKLLDALMMKGTDTTPVQSWTQGLARMLDAAGNAYEDKQLKAQEKASNDKFNALANAMLGLGSAPPPGGTTPSLGPIASDGQPAPTPPADIPAVASTSPDKGGFVAQMAPHALKVAQETGLDPRLVIAQAALETGYGKSAPGNNFFGIKSHGAPGGNVMATTEVVNGQPVRTSDSFRAYADMGDSAAGYANFLRSNPRYAPLLAAQGLDAQIAALGKSGYATDPDYAAKIAAIAKGINLPPNALAAINQAAPVQVASNAPGLGYAPSSGGASLSGQMPAPADDLTVRALQDYARRKNLQPPSPEMGPASPLQNVPVLPGSAPILPPGLSAANGPAGGAGLVNPDAPAPGAMQAGPAPLRDTGDGSYNNPFLEGSPEAKAAGANLPAAGAVPAGPAAFPGATASGMDRAKMALAIAMNPSFSPQQRQMAMSMATMLQNQDKATYQTLPDGTIIQLDPTGRQPPKPVYQAQTKAQWGVISKDEFGREQYGWIDPISRSVVPGPPPSGAQAGASPAQGGQPAIPPPPPGVDPKEWRRLKTEDLANGGPKMSEAQTNANLFVTRMEKSNAVLDQTEKAGTSATNRALDWLPGGNYLRNDQAQMYDQAKRDFVNAVLRKESGAAIGKEEFANAEKQYFPQPGDSAKVIEQKRQNRMTAIDGMRTAAGPAYKQKPVKQGPNIGDVEQGYRFKGGNPADPNAWEKVN